MAVTWCFDSHFLRRPNADNIVTKLQQSLQKLVAEKMIQMSMDGPTTIGKMSNQRNVKSKKEWQNTLFKKYWKLWATHSLQCTPEWTKKKTSWKLDQVLKSIWKLFQDSPAQRDIYVMENKSTIFPMKFCLTCWLENVTVTERAVFSVLTVVKCYEGLAPSKKPKNKSY